MKVTAPRGAAGTIDRMTVHEPSSCAPDSPGNTCLLDVGVEEIQMDTHIWMVELLGEEYKIGRRVYEVVLVAVERLDGDCHARLAGQLANLEQRRRAALKSLLALVEDDVTATGPAECAHDKRAPIATAVAMHVRAWSNP